MAMSQRLSPVIQETRVAQFMPNLERSHRMREYILQGSPLENKKQDQPYCPASLGPPSAPSPPISILNDGSY
jgi:hypothetical protein